MTQSVMFRLGACCVLLLTGGCIPPQQTLRPHHTQREKPYQAQEDALTAAYQRGELSANEYFGRMNEIEQLRLRRAELQIQNQQQHNYVLEIEETKKPIDLLKMRRETERAFQAPPRLDF